MKPSEMTPGHVYNIQSKGSDQWIIIFKEIKQSMIYATKAYSFFRKCVLEYPSTGIMYTTHVINISEASIEETMLLHSEFKYIQTLHEYIKCKMDAFLASSNGPKYSIGQWVSVIDHGQTYSTHDDAFKSLGFDTSKMKTTPSFLYNHSWLKYGKVFAHQFNDEDRTYMYGIEYDGKQQLIAEKGITCYTPQKGDFVVITNNQGSWIDDYEGEYNYPLNSNCADKSYTRVNHVTHCRPADKDEIKTLVCAVEDKFNKTYCETSKTWIDYVWTPVKGDKFFYINLTGEVMKTRYDGLITDKKLYESGNCFKTKSAAKLAQHKIKEVLKHSPKL